jgi:uncharacterized protein YbgA (DUF1722 family)/uncharacterized protein YbbK (DUF523 family)
MTENSEEAKTVIRVGVSSCLLGQEVRYDSGHKKDRYLTDILDDYVEWVSVCPEVESGMSTPRPAMRLVEDGQNVRMAEIKSNIDHTTQMTKFSQLRVRKLRDQNLCGYILKKNSPSCGMTRVKIWKDKGMPRRDGRGLYASALMDAYPNLPVEEEGRLHDAALRENFIERVFAYRRLQDLFRPRWTVGQVMKFHTAHKLQLMAHSPVAYRTLGQLVAVTKEVPRATFRSDYEDSFMTALAQLASRGRNTNALQHAAGYVKTKIDSASRNELADLIHDYRNGLVPLVVPLSLLRHHIRVHEIDYLAGQSYLQPHPKELMLRNHV